MHWAGKQHAGWKECRPCHCCCLRRCRDLRCPQHMVWLRQQFVDQVWGLEDCERYHITLCHFMLHLLTLSCRGAMHMPRPCNDSETGTASAKCRPTSWYVLTRATTTTPSSSRASLSSLTESRHTALRPYICFAPLFLLCIVLPALAVLLRFLHHRK